MARSIRSQPFCWQEKKILRMFRKVFDGAELAKYRNLYGAVTEMDSDFNGKDIKYYTKTIGTYSGLSCDWIPKGLKTLQDMGILEIHEDRIEGRFVGRYLVFTPENIKEEIEKFTIPVKTGNGKTVNGELGTLEHSSLLENNSLQEDSLLKNKQKEIIPEKPKRKKKRKLSENKKFFLESKQNFIKIIKDIYPSFKTDKDGFKRLETFYDTKIFFKDKPTITNNNETYFIKNLEACLELCEDKNYFYILKNYVGTSSENSKNYHQENFIEKLEYKNKSKSSSRKNPQHKYCENNKAAQELTSEMDAAEELWDNHGIQTPGRHFFHDPKNFKGEITYAS